MLALLAQRPTLVLMAGYGGSGKTTLAHTLGSELGWPVIDKDIFKPTILRLTHDMTVVNNTAYELLFVQARDYLVQQRRSVILDFSAAYPEVITTVDRLVWDANAILRIIFCKANFQIRYERLRQRNLQDDGRRQLVIDLSKVDDDNWQRFEHLPLEHLIEIDTSQPFEKYMQKALLYLLETRPGVCPLSH